VSVCPANNKPIAEVITGNVEDYESCVKAAEEAWQVIEKVSHGIHQTIQKNSVGFTPWDGITVGKDRIP